MVTTPIPEVLTYFRSPRRSQPVWELQLGLRPAPEFEQWLHAIGMVDDDGRLTPFDVTSSPLRALTISGAR
ncbi:hypothetical protein [Mycobacteroides abscessus]|uniref:hypothetical protein n=1 Tax=Mycobacteroides abscessus TaxID=36809 RepID=UPI000A7F3DF5